VWSEGTRTLTSGAAPSAEDVAGAVWEADGRTLSTAPPTADAIVDAMLDEPMSEHLVSGTVGAAINASGSSGNPLEGAVPGTYAPGTLGYIVGTNLDAKVSEVGGGSGPTAEEIADAVLDEATSGHATPGSVGAALAHLDADVSSRTAGGTYAAAPSASDNAAAVWAAEERGLTEAVTLAEDAIDADAIASSAVTVLQSGLATSDSQTTINNNVIALPEAVWAEESREITGGTVTNLTNAPTNGDLTPTMKASVTTAATAATPTAAAVTGNVGGNVVGSVGSVTSKTGFALSTEGIDAILNRPLTEGYSTATGSMTLAQFAHIVSGRLVRFSITGDTVEVFALDGSTTAYTIEHNNAEAPTSAIRAT
jgi:hypothetical protein